MKQLYKNTILITMSAFMYVSYIVADDNSGLTSEKLLPQFSNLTPEAASLGKYGAFQVSEYSGAANISIPLYNVRSGDISFPINLYYDATGIKVEQDATFVGLGWNLSYGGMISHIICGEDDFRESTGFREYNQNFWQTESNYDNACEPVQKYESVSIQGGLGTGNAIFSGTEEKQHLYDRLSRGYDSPDVFQASFCGHNVSFVIDKRFGKDSCGTYPIVILNDNSNKYVITYKMELTICGEKYPSSFTIIDDKGVSYEFSAYSENVDSSEHKDSYYLSKIYGSDGINGKSLITFDYDQSSIYFGSGSRPISKDNQSTAQEVGDVYLPPVLNKSLSLQLVNDYNRLVGKIKQSVSQNIGCNQNGISHKVYPIRINTSTDTIVFLKTSRTDLKNALCISSIRVKSNAGNILRNIEFKYDYFEEESSKYDYSGQRLKLTDLTIDDQKYKFQYDTSKLPAFSSCSKDYWGYYNGANQSDTKIVACTPAYSISNNQVVSEEHLEGSNRLASEKLCNIGMLKRVIYPTGGYTDYEYECHRFNDKYYYPDASSNIKIPSATSTVFDLSIPMYGNMTQSKNFSAAQINYNLKIEASLINTNDNYTITLKNNSGDIVKEFYFNGINQINENATLSLEKGSTYTIVTKLVSANGTSSTLAQCSLSHLETNQNIIVSPVTKDENGGYSIGGGLRIKSIKNYNSNDVYLNGVKYEYLDGKLLSPTVQLEKHFVDFTLYYKEDEFVLPEGIKSTVLYSPVKYSFYYANTEPSYPYICSLGYPVTVGYDTVIKNEIDENGSILRKTVLNFHNYGYITDDGNSNSVNEKMQNCFFFNSYCGNNSINSAYPTGDLNGMLKKETRYSDNETISYTAEYSYKSKLRKSFLFSKCIPTFLPGYSVEYSTYDYVLFRRTFTWNYMTSKRETQYYSDGSSNSNTSTYSYNSSNYQISDQTLKDDLNTMRTCYWYPSDNKTDGSADLLSKNCLSELTSVDKYINDVYIGGSRVNYALKNNLPVVSSLYTILPNKNLVEEFSVSSYDAYGNIRQYTKKDGIPVTVIWSYNHQVPVLEIVGKTYSQVVSACSSITELENSVTVKKNQIKSVYDAVRANLSDALVTAIEYSPWLTVSRIIKPNGYVVDYSYDQYGRLAKISDGSGVIKRFYYNFMTNN